MAAMEKVIPARPAHTGDAQCACYKCIAMARAHLVTLNTLERIACNDMPEGFTPSRAALVALARLAIEYRGGLRN